MVGAVYIIGITCIIMNKQIFVRPRVNKRNGQINISLKKKDLSKKIIDEIYNKKSLKMWLEDS